VFSGAGLGGWIWEAMAPRLDRPRPLTEIPGRRNASPRVIHLGGMELSRLAISATNHCLTGCAIGEITGFVIATSLGWSDFGQIGLAVGLAYLFGFGLTALPLVRAGLSAGVVVTTALAADTISITIMEVIDNVTVVIWPGALEAGVGDPVPYIAVAVGFVIAHPFAFLANRYLIARGKGHTVAHEYY
jgi:Domain of unknown function (DUF4396)